MNSWRVCKRDGKWRVYKGWSWAETFDTLEEAHTSATQNAVADTLYAPGGLTLLKKIKSYRTGCGVVS